jgi:hypothetical protein
MNFNMLMTETNLTTALFLTSVLTIAAVVWKEKQSKTSLDPSLIPSTTIMLLASVISLLSLVHLVNLYGIHTGR